MVELELSRLRQRPDEARKYLREGLELYPKNSVMYLTLAQLEMTARRTDEAIACLRRGLREVPRQGQIQLMHMLTLCLLQRGDEEEVKQMITALQERHAPVALINELNARVLMAKGQWTEAAAILEKTQGMVAGDAFAEAQLGQVRRGAHYGGQGCARLHGSNPAARSGAPGAGTKRRGPGTHPEELQGAAGQTGFVAYLGRSGGLCRRRREDVGDTPGGRKQAGRPRGIAAGPGVALAPARDQRGRRA